MRKRQQGVALVTAVLITALVTATAVAMASRQHLDIRRSANMFHSDQAFQAALGGEDYARNLLEFDLRDGQVDHLGEAWAEPVVFPFEEMVLSGQIADAQGRYNLNNLLKEDGSRSEEDIRQFKRMLKALQLDQSIAEKVVDWLDENIDPQPNGGAEDDFYMGQEIAYRAANRLMVSASELRLIKDIDQEIYETLEPFVTTLPSRTKLNVNTAPAEVLTIVKDDLSVADGETLIEARGEDGFASAADFLNEPLLQVANPGNGNNNNNAIVVGEESVDIKSSYFLITAMAEYVDSRSQLTSLLHRRDDGTVKTVMRSRGAF